MPALPTATAVAGVAAEAVAAEAVAFETVAAAASGRLLGSSEH